jgi:hypothetical protein
MRRTLALLALAALTLAAGISAHAQSEDNTIYLPALNKPLDYRLRAGYLGAAGADALSAVDFAANDDLLAAGSFPGFAPAGVAPLSLLGGGDGAVLRLDPTGSQLLAITRVGADLADMEASASGPVVVCGSFGVAALSADLTRLLWSDSPGAVSRCAIGADGSVAALAGGSAYRYNPDGGGRASWALAGTSPADIAIDSASGLVFVAGYTQKASDLKVAYLRAYEAAGELRWTNYDQSASAVKGASLAADSEGRRVTIGRDGKLYFAAWTDGGNAIYGRDPRDLSRRLGGQELIKFDNYNDPFNISGAKSLAWYGRFEPDSGALLRGQWLLTRLNDGKGNSISIRAIDAAEDGTLLLAGDSAYAIKGRVGMQLGGVTLGDYESGEPFFMVMSPDLTARRLWTALAAPGTSAGSSALRGAAIRAGVLVAGGTLSQRASAPPRALFTSADAPQPALVGGAEGYLLTMPTP